jgi:predicted phage terminase large subunit-like protein
VAPAEGGPRGETLDQIRKRLGFPDTVAAVEAMTGKYPKDKTILIEDKANGPAVTATLKSKIGGLIAVNPEGGKISRANGVSPMAESGNVFLPHPAAAPWVDDFIEECAAFPQGRYDDQVDQMTQALLRILKDRRYARSRATFTTPTRAATASMHGWSNEPQARTTARAPQLLR